METVRDILAAHHSGISKPGLLAWARLRIDTGMTDVQLDEELASLGDDVVDVDGFLYLRRNLEMARREAAPGAAPAQAAPAPGATPVTPAAGPGSGTRGRMGLGLPRLRLPGLRTLVWLAVFLVWAAGVVGVPLGPGDATPVPTTEPVPTTWAGTVVDVNEIVAGDCIVMPSEDQFSMIRRVPCDTAHDAEVILVAAHPDGGFPGDAGFEAFADERCRPAFADWTGSDVDAQDTLEIGWFTPTSEGWVAGDRTVQCYLGRSDGAAADRSYRGAKP